MRFLWKALYSQADHQRKSLNMSWREIAQLCEVTPSVFTRIKNNRPVSIINFLKVWNGCIKGWDISTFVKRVASIKQSKV